MQSQRPLLDISSQIRSYDYVSKEWGWVTGAQELITSPFGSRDTPIVEMVVYVICMYVCMPVHVCMSFACMCVCWCMCVCQCMSACQCMYVCECMCVCEVPQLTPNVFLQHYLSQLQSEAGSLNTPRAGRLS